MSWTDERVELLSRLWLDGRSASQIAAALGAGLTRNAVIGKVHRLGLAGRVKSDVATPSASHGFGVRGVEANGEIAAAPRRVRTSIAAANGALAAAVAGPRVQGNTALAIAPATAEAKPCAFPKKSWCRCRSR